MAVNEKNVLYAENALAKYFTEHDASRWHDVKNVLEIAKISGVNIRRAEFQEARKRLGINSREFNSVYRWKWESGKSPMEVWLEKSREIFG